jgi:hypothetical protein
VRRGGEVAGAIFAWSKTDGGHEGYLRNFPPNAPHYELVDHTHDERGLAPRRFGSFLEAADEAALSRLYGGIHFRAAIENGLAQGRRIGRAVSRVRLRR